MSVFCCNLETYKKEFLRLTCVEADKDKQTDWFISSKLRICEIATSFITTYI